MSAAVWVDNHCHLDACRPLGGDPGGDPRGAAAGAAAATDAAAATAAADATAADRAAGVEAVLDEAVAGGVAAFVTVGTDLERSRDAVAAAERFGRVWATVGVHPHDASGGTAGLADLARAGQVAGTVVAVGECGLDYHYDHSPRPVQRRVFAEQVGLAHELGLPLVIHTREAWDDTFAVLASEGTPPRTVFHCFTGGPAEAERCLAAGAHLSVSGIVTFGSAAELRAAVAAAPPERLMVETDAPYLAPVPHRGRRNRPALVARVGEEVAALVGWEVAELARRTSATAAAFYGFDLDPVGVPPLDATPGRDGDRGGA